MTEKSCRVIPSGSGCRSFSVSPLLRLHARHLLLLVVISVFRRGPLLHVMGGGSAAHWKKVGIYNVELEKQQHLKHITEGVWMGLTGAGKRC